MLVGAGAGLLLGCGRGIAETLAGSARLSARPGSPTEAASPGTLPLGSRGEPSGFLQVPATYRPETPIPLIVALHGAGGRARDPLERLSPLAEARGFGVVAMNSAAPTWDAIRGSYGPDVARIDAALQQVFQRVRVDPARLVIQGFSDGAS
jgi:phospholipase/carboxylesterase